MSDDDLLYLCAAGGVALIGYIFWMLFGKRDGEKLRGRLTGAGSFSQSAAAAQRDKKKSFKELAQRVGQAAATPFMPKTSEKQSGIRMKLAKAGIYSPSAIKVVTGAKVIALAAGVGGGYALGLYMDSMMMGLALGGLIGYMTPGFIVNKKITANQRALTEGLADALDLMVVCVEAGLTIDGAMQRVGQELAIAHPAISREFSIATMEGRVGLSRAETLRNLGKRTGNTAIQSLTSMMIQAEKFGTSIGSALRIHADTLRTNRKFAAEESASKASVKLTFPLVLFIFPATFIVLAGPTAVQLMDSELMK